MHFAADWGSYQYLRFTSALGRTEPFAIGRRRPQSRPMSSRVQTQLF